MPEPAVAEAQTTLRPQDLDQTDKKLLTVIQADFPLSVRPYEAFGKRLGLSEAETIERVRRLKAGRILRQVGAIFDTRRLGYQSSLVAARYSKERLDEAAGIVSAHPGVSHNYGRNHAFNLWYTIALPPGVSMERTIDRLHALSGAEATRLLPTLKLFKIGAHIRLSVRRVWIAFSNSYPHAGLFRPILRKLQRIPLRCLLGAVSNAGEGACSPRAGDSLLDP